MKPLAALILVLLFGAWDPLFAFEDYPEPPFEYLVAFDIEEIPGKATLYYDLDADGEADLVTAHDIIGVERPDRCPLTVKRAQDILIGTECNSRWPVVYFLKRAIIAVRWVDEKWSFVVKKTWRRCVSKNYETGECRREEENVTLAPQ